MARLIHVNGPPGIGKSTIASLYADRHPGTLNLDIDRLHTFVGGWQDPELRIFHVLRPLALAMAGAHLAGGRDVVLPQYLSRTDEITACEEVAVDAGAEFREVVLLDTRERALERFARRDAAQPDDPWAVYVRRMAAEQGGPAFLGRVYDELLPIVVARPSAVVVPSEPGAVEATYAALVAALG